MIVSVGSRKGSPGVTTLTSLLAAYWSDTSTSRLIVEADESGGTLAARWTEAHNITWNPGLIELATMRRSPTSASLAEQTQPLADGLYVAAAPPAPGQVIQSLASMGDEGAGALAAASDVTLFVDCGRLTGRSAALPLARRSALTILVCRPDLEAIHSALAGVVELTALRCSLGLVLVGKGKWKPDEIAQRTGVDVLGVVSQDAKAASLFNSRGLRSGRRFAKSDLGKSIAELTSTVQSRCAGAMRPVPVPEELVESYEEMSLSKAIEAGRTGAREVREQPLGLADRLRAGDHSSNGAG